AAPRCPQPLEVPHLVARKREGPQGDSEFPRQFDAGRHFAHRRLARTAVVAENHVRERMTADLLRNGTVKDLLDQTPPEEDRVFGLAPSRVVREPIVSIPVVRRTDDLRMFARRLCFAALQEQMAHGAPGRRDLEFNEQLEQASDDLFPLQLTDRPEALRPEKVQRPPNQLQVKAQGESPAFELNRLHNSHARLLFLWHPVLSAFAYGLR